MSSSSKLPVSGPALLGEQPGHLHRPLRSHGSRNWFHDLLAIANLKFSTDFF